MDDREKRLADIRWVISTPQGRRFYWSVMAECKSFSDRYCEESNKAYFDKGRRSVGLDLFHDLLEAKAEAFMQMQHENKAKVVREEIKVKENIKKKSLTSISSPVLPNTGARASKEVSYV